MDGKYGPKFSLEITPHPSSPPAVISQSPRYPSQPMLFCNFFCTESWVPHNFHGELGTLQAVFLKFHGGRMAPPSLRRLDESPFQLLFDPV